MKVIVNNKIPKGVFVIINLIIITLGLIVLYGGTRGFVDILINKGTKIETVITSSEVKNISRFGENSASKNYERVVEYDYYVENEKYSGSDNLWWRISYRNSKNVNVGDKINIIYNNSNPAKSYVYHISLPLIIVSCGFIFLPIVFIKKRLSK